MENHHFLMGKLTISMVIFNSYVKLPTYKKLWEDPPFSMGKSTINIYGHFQ